jgi:large subunit ribosomal protein L15
MVESTKSQADQAEDARADDIPPGGGGVGTASASRGHGLKVHHLRPAPGAHKPKTRVGRGEGSKGKTAGRGTKGSKARKQVPARFEGGQMPLHLRVPKLKGFRNRFRTEYQVVNVTALARLFPHGSDVGVDELVAAGAVRPKSLVKVLGDGEIDIALNVSAHAFSASAKEKIQNAGGTTNEL